MDEDKKDEKSFLSATVIETVSVEPIPTIFIDGLHGISINGDTVRINLVEDRFDVPDKAMRRHVVARLVMTRGQFYSFASVLAKTRAEMAPQENLPEVNENEGK